MQQREEAHGYFLIQPAYSVVTADTSLPRRFRQQ
jgi:hypothetical protein